MTSRAQRRRRRRRIAAASGVLVLVVLIGIVALLGWYRSQLSASGGPHRSIVVTVPKGSSSADIGHLLADAGVVKNATAFDWHVRFSNAGPFQAGRFRFKTNSSVDDAIAVLTKGPLGPVITKIPIPEGFRLAQIVARIHARVPRFSKAQITAALTKGDVSSPLLPAGSHDFEGLLFPATYAVTPKWTATQLLQNMADTMTRRVQGLNVDPSLDALHLSSYQVVVVASLVQAEAGNPEEAPKIARVIYNRLAAGEPLGIDATSRYLSIITGDPVDFGSDSPYNTRLHSGLPPTPIGAPGDVALDAAAHPATGDWLYYVRDVHNDAQGRPQHVFTNSPEVFARAKQACHDAGLGCGAP